MGKQIHAKTGNAISNAQYAARRERVFKALKGSVGVVFAGEGAPPLLGKWRADCNFTYLTGIDNEPGACVVFDPTAESPKRRITLLLRPLDPEAERWDGYRETIGSALREKTGFATVMRAKMLPRLLTVAARRSKRLACLHPFSVYPAAASPDLAVFRQLAERIAGLQIEDQTDLLPSMRAVKSSAEIALMRKAASATAAGFDAMFKMVRPGVSEGEIAQALERGYRQQGGSGVAYNSIVGSGMNATVLHYMDNSATVKDGELIVIDSAASFDGYAADVTRTVPVNGKFSIEQREVYEVVLKAQLAAIKAARTGVLASDVDNAARDVIEKAGYGDAFIHGTGHQLGL